jgi:hypothetical protein
VAELPQEYIDAVISAGPFPAGRTDRMILSILPNGGGEWILAKYVGGVPSDVSASILDAFETLMGENPTSDGGLAAYGAVLDGYETIFGENPVASAPAAGVVNIPDGYEAAIGEDPVSYGGTIAVAIPDASEIAAAENPVASNESGGPNYKTTINGYSAMGQVVAYANPPGNDTGTESNITMTTGNIQVDAQVVSYGGDGPSNVYVYLYVDGAQRDSVMSGGMNDIPNNKTLTYAVSAGVHSIRVVASYSNYDYMDYGAANFRIPIP